MTHLNLAELTRELRAAAAPRSPKASTWRQQDWLRWRDEYLGRTGPGDRLAWVCLSRTRGRLATLEALWLGGLQFRTGQPVDPGTVLRVEVMDGGSLACEPMAVRVINVSRQGKEWLVSCCFAQEKQAA